MQWNSNDTQKEQRDLDERLAAYYGPQLREQPLPQASWQSVRQRLTPRRSVKLPHIRLRQRWRRRQRFIPADVHAAFQRVAYESRNICTLAMLRYTQKAGIHEPAVRISLLPRPALGLILPREPLSASALDVLIATGAARYHIMRQARALAIRFLLTSIALFSCMLATLSWLYHWLQVDIPIAIVLCSCSCGIMLWRRRHTALLADRLVVYWLGRERTCQGLHALADHSRTPYRGRWGEPSLSERITRVCATRVATRNGRRLTLAR